jgi:hypothetical protein
VYPPPESDAGFVASSATPKNVITPSVAVMFRYTIPPATNDVAELRLPASVHPVPPVNRTPVPEVAVNGKDPFVAAVVASVKFTVIVPPVVESVPAHVPLKLAAATPVIDPVSPVSVPPVTV